jgi:hypothetical protein
VPHRKGGAQAAMELLAASAKGGKSARKAA